MNNIKFGLKLWSTNDNLIEEAKELIEKDIFHYVEILVVPDTEFSPFQKTNIPYIIHITNERWGVDIGDKSKEDFNLKTINQCIQWANELSAEYLILHLGYKDFRVAKSFLDKIEDKRILIENVPKVGLDEEEFALFDKANVEMIGFSPEQIKELIGDKFGFCLDFGHSTKAAISLKKDYKDYIKEFLKLNPMILHISDGRLNNEKDEHLNIGEGDYDFDFLADCIKKSQAEYISLETPRNNLNSLSEDLKNLEKLKSVLFKKTF